MCVQQQLPLDVSISHKTLLHSQMENGIYEGGSGCGSGNCASAPSLETTDFIVGFVKGNSGNHYAIKAGDPQTAGSLKTVHDGPRPKGYELMKKQGGIILGIGGDNSPVSCMLSRFACTCRHQPETRIHCSGRRGRGTRA